MMMVMFSMFVLMRLNIRVGMMRGGVQAWLIFFAVDDDVGLACADAAAVHAREFQACTEVQSSDCLLKNRLWNSSIHQSAKKHVAADAGKAIEVGNSHNRC